MGVERICQTAGVSKRSMYQLFESKDAMIAESLRRFGARTTAHLLEADSVDDPPRERIMTVFQRLEDQTSGGSFAGCPFVSTAVELKDPTHRAVAVAVELKNQMTDFFADRARDAGVPGAADLAEALTAVFDGCAVRAVMRDAPLDGLAMRTAQAVLDSYGLTS